MTTTSLRRPAWQRALALMLSLALALGGCAVPPPQQDAIYIDAIVVGGERRAADNERGLARVWRDGQELDGHPGLALRRGDVIESGPLSDVVIRYPGGSVLYMRPGSRGRIGSFLEAVGEFFAKIKGTFSVETTFVRAAAKGTAYLVRAGVDGVTTVIVFESRGAVGSICGGWGSAALGPGKKSLAEKRGPQSVNATEAELRRTQEWVERVERLAPETGPRAESGSTLSTGAALAIGAAILGILLSRDKHEPPAAQGHEPGGEPGDNTSPTTR